MHAHCHSRQVTHNDKLLKVSDVIHVYREYNEENTRIWTARFVEMFQCW